MNRPPRASNDESLTRSNEASEGRRPSDAPGVGQAGVAGDASEASDPNADDRQSRPDPAFYKRRRKRGNEICQILLRNGDIEPEHVRQGLKIQEERGGQIGRILIQMGACSERAIARALLKQVQLNHAAGRTKNVSMLARENPGIAGLDVSCSPSRTKATIVLADLTVLSAVGLFGGLIGYLRAERITPALFHYGIPALIFLPLMFALMSLYSATAPSPPEEIRLTTTAVTATFLGDAAVAIFGMQWIPWHVHAVLFLEWALCVVFLPLGRAFVRHAFARKPWWGHPVVILGAGKTGRILVRALNNRPHVGLRPVVVLDDDRKKHGTLRASVTNDEIHVNSIRDVPAHSRLSIERTHSRDSLDRGTARDARFISTRDVNQMARELASSRDFTQPAGGGAGGLGDSEPRASSSDGPPKSLVDSDRPPGHESVRVREADVHRVSPAYDSNQRIAEALRGDSNRPPSSSSAGRPAHEPSLKDSSRSSPDAVRGEVLRGETGRGDAGRSETGRSDSNRPPSDSNRPPTSSGRPAPETMRGDSNRPTADSVRSDSNRPPASSSRPPRGPASRFEGPLSSRRRADGTPESLRGARGQFSEIEGVPVIGGLELAPLLAHRLNIPFGILAMPGVSSRKLLSLTERAGGAFSHLLVIPDLFGFASLGVPARDVAGVLGIEVRQQLLLPGPRLAKRLMDIVFTLAGGIFVLPVIVLLAIMIKLDSAGPVFYSQQRLGRDGLRFTALKFRSMHGDGEKRLKEVLDNNSALRAEYEEFHKLSFDPRVTRIGRALRKYSLDELPQLWNVLRGDMSLVGPRPYLEREIPDMDQQEGMILRAMPGMTGMWQVSDRNATGFAERVKMDVHYVRNWSPWLDIYILARTIGVVIGGTGT